MAKGSLVIVPHQVEDLRAEESGGYSLTSDLCRDQLGCILSATAVGHVPSKPADHCRRCCQQKDCKGGARQAPSFPAERRSASLRAGDPADSRGRFASCRYRALKVEATAAAAPYDGECRVCSAGSISGVGGKPVLSSLVFIPCGRFAVSRLVFRARLRGAAPRESKDLSIKMFDYGIDVSPVTVRKVLVKEGRVRPTNLVAPNIRNGLVDWTELLTGTGPGVKEWKAMSLTREHKPESKLEQERIYKSGGKVVLKAGVPRVVWNRPRRGHQGPVRRSTPIDEIPFLSVARSLGDLWSYHPESNQFVVSPVPDVMAFKVNTNTYRCLILGTDGLWNMLKPSAAVKIVQAANDYNKEQVSLSEKAEQLAMWVNPSKKLVDEALRRWSAIGCRADNTSALTLMLDPARAVQVLCDTLSLGLAVEFDLSKPPNSYIGDTPTTLTSESTYDEEHFLAWINRMQQDDEVSDEEDEEDGSDKGDADMTLLTQSVSKESPPEDGDTEKNMFVDISDPEAMVEGEDNTCPQPSTSSEYVGPSISSEFTDMPLDSLTCKCSSSFTCWEWFEIPGLSDYSRWPGGALDCNQV
uniref:PPM-type phosphatase domain-containing protein n=2 Tax=Timema TaxID=61471 RepID=A0A7R9F3A9_9NEOP|nr:unnamed protein product [Timema bartmani]